MPTPNNESPTSENVFALSDELVLAMASLQPSLATFRGVSGYDGAWDDFSPEGTAAVIASLKGYRARLSEFAPPSPEDRWGRLATHVMKDTLEQDLDRYEGGDPLDDLNSIASTFQRIRMVFDVMDTSTPEAWSHIVRRLETIDGACRGYRATLAAGRAAGKVASVRQVRSVIEQARVQTGEDSFFRSLPDAMRRAGIEDSSLHARLEAAVPLARRVFADLADDLEQTYLPSAPVEDGVGRERYLHHARRFLGMDIDPIETYAWGFEEVRKIGDAMRRAADEILPGASLPEVIRLLKTDPARCAESPEAFLDLMRARQERALADLDGKHFAIPSVIRAIDVKLAPRGGSLGAYYVGPSEDFSRPGTVWYALGEETRVPLYDHISTAYHEGFPGHHLQVGTQVSLTDRLCRAHRLSDSYHGYAEGWALYTEHLMQELGYYESPDYVLGMLTTQMMRACRVVIDIGAHLGLSIPSNSPFHPGETWSFDLGVEMMRDVAYLPADHAASEMARYMGWPGQAISYKVGERVILDLREEERRRLGPAFRLRDFHATIVGSGPVGLSHLRELVRQGGTEAALEGNFQG